MLATHTICNPLLILTLAAAVSTFVAPAASAGQVYMLNGDVITADIKKIWDKDVTIEATYSDDFNIDLDAVAYFESEREFDIEFADGREATAKLVGGSDGTQVLEIDGVTQEIPVMQLAELEEPEDHFDWDSNIDLNSTVNTGNTDNAAATLQFRTNVKLGDHRHIGSMSFSREEQGSVTVKEQDRIEYAYNWTFRDPWFMAINAAGERDPIRDLNHRLNLGGGIGYNIWDDAARFFQIQAVGGYLTEEFKERDPDTGEQTGTRTNDSVIAGWILRFNYRVIDDLTIFHNHSATANISGRSNNIFQSETGVRYEITDLLYANFQFDFDTESEPAPGTENTDTTTLLGLGLEF